MLRLVPSKPCFRYANHAASRLDFMARNEGLIYRTKNARQPLQTKMGRGIVGHYSQATVE